MQNFLIQKNNIIVIACAVLLLGVGGVYFYLTTSDSSESSQTAVDTTLLKKDIKDYLSVKDSISFEDVSFKKSPFFPVLKNNTEVIEMSPSRGRDNPFLPYAAPGSIR